MTMAADLASQFFLYRDFGCMHIPPPPPHVPSLTQFMDSPRHKCIGYTHVLVALLPVLVPGAGVAHHGVVRVVGEAAGQAAGVRGHSGRDHWRPGGGRLGQSVHRLWVVALQTHSYTLHTALVTYSLHVLQQCLRHVLEKRTGFQFHIMRYNQQPTIFIHHLSLVSQPSLKQDSNNLYSLHAHFKGGWGERVRPCAQPAADIQ